MPEGKTLKLASHLQSSWAFYMNSYLLTTSSMPSTQRQEITRSFHTPCTVCTPMLYFSFDFTACFPLLSPMQNIFFFGYFSCVTNVVYYLCQCRLYDYESTIPEDFILSRNHNTTNYIDHMRIH